MFISDYPVVLTQKAGHNNIQNRNEIRFFFKLNPSYKIKVVVRTFCYKNLK